MRQRILWMSAVALLFAGAADAETRVGVNISIGNAPPPPVVVLRREPRVIYVPEARVYVVNDSRRDQDWFRVGRRWYLERGGWWYVADHYRGPYRMIERRYVPRVVWKVPKKYWKRHGDAGGSHGYRDRDRDRDDDDDDRRDRKRKGKRNR